MNVRIVTTLRRSKWYNDVQNKWLDRLMHLGSTFCEKEAYIYVTRKQFNKLLDTNRQNIDFTERMHMIYNKPIKYDKQIFRNQMKIIKMLLIYKCKFRK